VYIPPYRSIQPATEKEKYKQIISAVGVTDEDTALMN
jgi:hypothetical protein